jgi:hypothetical protein
MRGLGGLAVVSVAATNQLLATCGRDRSSANQSLFHPPAARDTVQIKLTPPHQHEMISYPDLAEGPKLQAFELFAKRRATNTALAFHALGFQQWLIGVGNRCLEGKEDHRFVAQNAHMPSILEQERCL